MILCNLSFYSVALVDHIFKWHSTEQSMNRDVWFVNQWLLLVGFDESIKIFTKCLWFKSDSISESFKAVTENTADSLTELSHLFEINLQCERGKLRSTFCCMSNFIFPSPSQTFTESEFMFASLILTFISILTTF